jgi:Family of unknown function (DUF6266)
MAKFYSGINGPFSGKVGAVVGYLYKGIPVMRSLPDRKKPSTPNELNQQERFRLMNGFLTPLNSLLNITFAHLAIRMTGRNKAFSYNLKNAVTGFRPNLAIDYSMVLLSRGDLPGAESPGIISSSSGLLEFSWNDNSGKGKAIGTDKVFIALYDTGTGHWIAEMDLATRANGNCKLQLKKGTYSEKAMHIYLGFIATNGKDAADSAYLGTVEVQSK